MVDEHKIACPQGAGLPGMAELIYRNIEGALHGRVPEVGLVVDETWELTRHLGEGGFGSVFEAWHIDLESRYAIKFLDARHDSDEVRSRFLAEARLMAEIHSEHLVRVLNYGELPGGVPYFVMDLVKGQNLRQYLQEPLPVLRALGIAEQVLTGLAVVHERQIVHGDIKPENIIIGDEDDKVRLLDFGLAHIAALVDLARGGTPPYMAPEMLFDDVSANFQTDVFAIGVVLYEMLAVRLPRGHGRMDYEGIGRCWRRKSDVDPLRMHRKDIPKPLDDFVLEALSRDPADRPESAEAMLTALRRVRQQISTHGEVEVSSGPHLATALAPRARARATMPKWRWAGPAAALGVLAMGLSTSPLAHWAADDVRPVQATAAPAIDVPSLDPSHGESSADRGGPSPPEHRLETTSIHPVAPVGTARRAERAARSMAPTSARPRARSLTQERFESTMERLREAACDCANAAEAFPGTEVGLVVRVDPSGRAHAMISGAEALLPIGACLDDVVEAAQFDQTHEGGLHEYVFGL